MISCCCLFFFYFPTHNLITSYLHFLNCNKIFQVASWSAIIFSSSKAIPGLFFPPYADSGSLLTLAGAVHPWLLSICQTELFQCVSPTDFNSCRFFGVMWMSLDRINSHWMIWLLHLRAIQWKKGDLILFISATETLQVDVASCHPMEGNSGFGCCGISCFCCIQCGS